MRNDHNYNQNISTPNRSPTITQAPPPKKKVKRTHLERLLHAPPPKPPQIASFGMRRTITLPRGELGEFFPHLIGGEGSEGLFVCRELGEGGFFGEGDVGLFTGEDGGRWK